MEENGILEISSLQQLRTIGRKKLIEQNVKRIKICSSLPDDRKKIRRLKTEFDMLEEVHMPEDGEIFSSDDGKQLFRKYANNVISLALYLDKKEKVIVPDGIRYIEPYAFYKCNVRFVELPDSIVSIKNCAFSKCKNLEEIRFSKNLIHIGNYCFGECDNLKEFSFPGSLERIGDYALPNFDVIRVERPVPCIFVAAAQCSMSYAESNPCYLLIYKDRKFMIPRNISSAKAKTIVKILNNEENISSKPRIYFNLLASFEDRCRFALMSLLLYNDSNAEKYIKSNFTHFSMIFSDKSDKKEKEFLEMLETFRNGSGLTSKMCDIAMKVAAENEWVQATALTLDISRNKEKPSFDL